MPRGKKWNKGNKATGASNSGRQTGRGRKVSSVTLEALVALLTKAIATTPVPAEIASYTALKVRVQVELDALTAASSEVEDPEEEDNSGWGGGWNDDSEDEEGE